MADAQNNKKNDAELKIDEKWDRCLERVARGFIYGTAVGVPLFILFWKFKSFRTFALGASYGGFIGEAIGKSEYDFESKELFHGKVVFKRNIIRDKPSN